MRTAKADTKPQNPENATPESTVPFRIRRQYLGDFSFENPGALKTLQNRPEKPQYNIHWHIGNAPIANETHLHQAELRLNLASHNETEKGEQSANFMLEISMMAIVEIAANIEDQNIHQKILRIDIPHLLFPYLRHQVDHILQSGGYPAMQLPALNFAVAYMQYLRQEEDNQKNNKKT